jgi:ribose-phosphate pyrophosphokinase
MLQKNIKLISGSANYQLSSQIANLLQLPLTHVECRKFSDGEVRVEIMESVRGKTVFIIQPTCPPVNDNLMELLLLIDACKRSGSKRIIAVIPYYGYSRGDKRPDLSRAPIASSLVAKMLEVAGVAQVMFVDIHSTQQVGFFSIPAPNISAAHDIIGDIWKKYGKQNPLIVSPDVGGVPRARAIATELYNADLAIIDKRRPEDNKSEVMNIIGDVKGRVCIIVDDMVDTAGTLCKGAAALSDAGAKSVVAYCTHGILSGDALKTIWNYNSYLDELVITDTIPLHLPNDGRQYNIRVISIAPMIAETIRRMHNKQSITEILL